LQQLGFRFQFSSKGFALEASLPLGIAIFGLIATTFAVLVNASLSTGKNTSMPIALGVSKMGKGVLHIGRSSYTDSLESQ
jgi:hypothetical protein